MQTFQRIRPGIAALALALLAGATLAQGKLGDKAPEAAAAPQQAAKPGGQTDDAAWALFSGWKRYHANCATCHGPDGMGSSFGPDLTRSLKALDHDHFLETVVNGKQEGDLAMPAFGTNPNVMCYIEDIYSYLKARSAGLLERGRPASPPKPTSVAEAETACMGS